MKPIEERADVAFVQALRCVEFRLPNDPELRRPGWLLALGLRYGLIGAAAAHHLILTSTEEESERLSELFATWSGMVEDHVRWDIAHRLPVVPSEALPVIVGKLAKKPLQIHLSLHPELVPLRRCLEIAVEEYSAQHERSIIAGWPILGRSRARRLFDRISQDSLEFALRFFERREFDLDEVPEIALIGD